MKLFLHRSVLIVLPALVVSLMLSACAATPTEAPAPMQPVIVAPVGTQWHASPAGTSEGDGSRERPWDLQTALNHPEAVKPGDTIWLHGGTYEGHFTSKLTGTAEKPIIVRQARGERAILDANYNRRTQGGAYSMLIEGAYTWFWGFELTSSWPVRTYADDEYGTVELPWGPDIGNRSRVPGIRLINLVIHDLAQGPGVWKGALDNEMYGCIVFNNGYDSPRRGHGHGTYTQSEEGTRRIVDNIMFNQYSHGIHAYGSSRAPLKGFIIEGNISFNNGYGSTTNAFTRNILVGGGQVAERPVVTNNCAYFNLEKTDTRPCCDLEYGKGVLAPVVKDNYFASGGRAFAMKPIDTSTVSGNTFAGTIRGFEPAQFPDNLYLDTARPTGTHVFIRPNQYEAGRANICVFNWDSADDVRVDLSGVLRKGDRFEVRDVQNWFGAPVVRGTYSGKPIALPMNLTTVVPPTAEPPRELKHTPKEFNAFVVMRVEGER